MRLSVWVKSRVVCPNRVRMPFWMDESLCSVVSVAAPCPFCPDMPVAKAAARAASKILFMDVRKFGMLLFND